MDSANVHIIIVAAGSGTRFGADVPKQFVDLCGRPVLMHTIDALRRAMPEATMSVVISRDMRPLWSDLCREHGFESPTLTDGGATRFESVGNAVRAIPASAEVVMVHDGVRPCVEPAMVRRIMEADIQRGVVPVVPVVPSMRMLTGDASVAVDRALYREVQTPQAFPAQLLKEAYNCPYRPQFTDDASVVEAYTGEPVTLADGDPANIKITHPADLVMAELWVKNHGGGGR